MPSVLYYILHRIGPLEAVYYSCGVAFPSGETLNDAIR
jgi:hypothetical protein